MKKFLTKISMLLGVFLLLGAGSASAWTDDDLFFRGEQYGWNELSDKTHFTKTGDNTYELFIDYLQADTEFKIGRQGAQNWEGWGNNTSIEGGQQATAWSNNYNNLRTGQYEMFNITIKVVLGPKYDWGSDMTITFEGPTGWWLHGNMTNNSWESIPLESQGNNNWAATIKPSNALNTNEFGIRELKNGNHVRWWSTNSTTIMTPGSNARSLVNNGSNVKCSDLKSYLGYTFTLNTSSNSSPTISISNPIYPEKMYVYGHLKDKYWHEDVYYEIPNVNKQSVYQEGIYYIENVDVCGTWSDFDSGYVENREMFESTKGENYLAFYDNKIENIEASGWKFCSDEKDNKNINKENGADYDTYQTANINYRGQSESYNFRVSEGLYWIKIDLTNMTVDFGLMKTPVELVWYEGGTLGSNAGAQETNDQNYHDSFVYGETNILQIAVEGNPTHRVARQVDYDVVYTPFSYTRNKAAALSEEEEEEEDAPYTLIGGNAYNNNHLIQLNKAGTYVITASVKENAENLQAYSGYDENNTITVVVAAAELTPHVGQDATVVKKPFATDTHTYTFTDIISFDQEVTYGTDFTVSVTPHSGYTWQAPSDPSNLQQSYQEALSFTYTNSNDQQVQGLLFKQYEDLNTEYVDGFYTGVGTISVTPDTGSADTFTVAVNLPCSGVYDLTINNVTGSNYTIAQPTSPYTIEVYPNLTGKFGTDMGFNIDGYTFVEGSDVIGLPTNFTASEKYNSVAYIPGTYFASSFVASADHNPTPTVVVEESSLVYRSDVNLTWLNNNNSSEDVKATIVKNGATGIYTFRVNKEGVKNTSTGVEAIGEAEDGEAVYFNLQGVKVTNPDKGIYVKVQNGKASKVVL